MLIGHFFQLLSLSMWIFCSSSKGNIHLKNTHSTGTLNIKCKKKNLKESRECRKIKMAAPHFEWKTGTKSWIDLTPENRILSASHFRSLIGLKLTAPVCHSLVPHKKMRNSLESIQGQNSTLTSNFRMLSLWN